MSLAPISFETTLPALLQGDICIQYTQCGKPKCKCRTGQPHGPYYYRVWRDGASVRKAYVRREALAETQAACDAYRAMMDRLKETRLQRAMLAKNIRREWRRTKAWRSARLD